MFRALLRRVPRFGFVTLFAAMLLFTSAAGWLKFQLDLWQEEQALLADLGKAGVDYSYSRQTGDVGYSAALAARNSRPPAKFWDPLVPYFSRIDNIGFRDGATRELLDRAARLPYVRSVSGGGAAPPPGTPTAETLAAKAGFEVETLQTPAIPADLPPLSVGIPVDEEDAVDLRKSFVAAFQSEKPAPTRGTAYSVLASPAARRFYARDANVRFGTFDGAFAITRVDSHDTYVVDKEGAWQNSRLDDRELATEILNRENPPLSLVDPSDYLVSNLEQILVEDQFQAVLQKPKSILVSRVDDVRVRFDFPPFEIDYAKADCRDAYSVSIVARSDLDWEAEAWEIVGSRIAGPNAAVNLPAASSASFRGTLRRERDWIVAEEWVVDYYYDLLPGPPAAPANGQPPPVGVSRTAGVARYDFSPDLDLSHMTPELFDARDLPPQRTLPWLPWHRATLALSLGLFAFVGVRKIFKSRALRRTSE